MSRKNAYLARQTAVRQQYIQAACDIYSQFVFDCALLVLHDHYGFGAERLDAFGALLNQYTREFDPALDTADPECGYTRDRMDAKLREALREKMKYDFEQRYSWMKKVKL